ncbi:MAG: hypothetical protein SVU32_04795, partial [Candidatus Nanohaloarchaea archaeon]|nr:hypothetical protein [Candidatus Nanohaloarchaea archaeon]
MRTIIRVVMAVVGVAGYFLVGSILGRLDEEAAAYSHTTRQKVFTDIWALKVLFAGEVAFVAGSAVRLLGGLWERE